MTTVHQLAQFSAAEIPGHRGMILLAIDGHDGSCTQFVIEQDGLERIVEALGAELVRLRARDTTH